MMHMLDKSLNIEMSAIFVDLGSASDPVIAFGETVSLCHKFQRQQSLMILKVVPRPSNCIWGNCLVMFSILQSEIFDDLASGPPMIVNCEKQLYTRLCMLVRYSVGPSRASQISSRKFVQ